jgi:hypothetical protein
MSFRKAEEEESNIQDFTNDEIKELIEQRGRIYENIYKVIKDFR